MRIEAVFQILAALAVAVTASPLSTITRHVVHERRSEPPPRWSRHTRLHPAATIPFRIGLAQQNLHRAEEFVNEVAHPDSPDYGKHWSKEKVADMFAPTTEAVSAVMEWLHASGIDPSRIKMSNSRNWLNFNATVAEAERLLRTEYHLYKHEMGHNHIACESYSVPHHLTDHIDIVTPTVHFDTRIGSTRKTIHHQNLPEPILELNRRMAKRDFSSRPLHGTLGSELDASNPKHGAEIKNALMTLENCDTMITPACLQALYNAPPNALSIPNNTLGVVEYTPQAFLQSDLDMFFKQFSPKQVGVSPNTNLIDGATIQTKNQSFSFNGESALDLQFAMSLIFPQKVTMYQVGDLVNGGSFNNFLDALDGSYCTFQGGDSKDPNIDGQYPDTLPGGFQGPENCGSVQTTNVISTSYSSNEADLTAKYEQRQCLEYMKLGLQGVSILYSSGDFGVAGNSGQCINPVTGAYNNGSTGLFNPSFPGTCPYITSVGATQILNGSTVHSPESASERVIFSGGGFSNVFPMPSYQKTAMATYFASHMPPYGADRFNNSQTVRGYPDVSANGVNYVVAVDGQFSLTFGTSASCPTFASLVNMINAQRIEARKSPVGFLNPTLYANPQVLHDITVGGNKGCGTKGFLSVQGWDPVTGLGTPNYPAMLDLFMGLP
ncbi:tripeptidyl peptidase-like protein [Hyaloscypha bicolor E]|uniref:tripeptidyl-peptidase II n=1 Tax=Hyaloscypha bicolor E TaxID=1095630 RepID=A0A2J6SUI5_9HELO|nr:tripeptidyl peptidase-like protein [Hyaloscypha bicolor E]PMD54431.1 tripeptidyl peptidase-like protein [Hyaloscypha bicolor E]